MIKIFYLYFLFIAHFTLYGSLTLEEKEDYTSCLGSLTYYYRQDLEDFKGKDDKIEFTQDELTSLWDRAAHYHYQLPKTSRHESKFENAYHNFFVKLNSSNEIKETYSLLEELWSAAIENEENYQELYERNVFLRTKSVANHYFENNQRIPSSIKSYMRPYIMPETHPMKEVMDAIFAKRVTYNEKCFLAAGFNIISKRPRSYVYVAKHPKLKGYIIKAYMDTEQRLKHYLESWNWLVKRCQGASKIRVIIKKNHFKHFRVARKWIYPLPDNNLPAKDSKHKFHLAVLLAQDMELIDHDANLRKWKNDVTKDMLKELYVIITRAKGSSYRPDNICFTRKGDLAFIDTEYPTSGPDYYSIRHYLSTPMKLYWDGLVKNAIR